MAFILQPKNEWSVQLFGISFVFFFLPLNSYSSPYWTIFWTPLLSIRFQIFINCPQKWNCCLYLLHIFFSDDKVVNQTNIQFATLQMLLLFEKKKGLTSWWHHMCFFTLGTYDRKIGEISEEKCTFLAWKFINEFSSDFSDSQKNVSNFFF